MSTTTFIHTLINSEEEEEDERALSLPSFLFNGFPSLFLEHFILKVDERKKRRGGQDAAIQGQWGFLYIYSKLVMLVVGIYFEMFVLFNIV